MSEEKRPRNSTADADQAIVNSAKEQLKELNCIATDPEHPEHNSLFECNLFNLHERREALKRVIASIECQPKEKSDPFDVEYELKEEITLRQRQGRDLDKLEIETEDRFTTTRQLILLSFLVNVILTTVVWVCK